MTLLWMIAVKNIEASLISTFLSYYCLISPKSRTGFPCPRSVYPSSIPAPALHLPPEGEEGHPHRPSTFPCARTQTREKPKRKKKKIKRERERDKNLAKSSPHNSSYFFFFFFFVSPCPFCPATGLLPASTAVFDLSFFFSFFFSAWPALLP